MQKSPKVNERGGAIKIGMHCVKTWSSTQMPLALSSAEVEYYAMVEGATRALGVMGMARELGVAVEAPETPPQTEAMQWLSSKTMELEEGNKAQIKRLMMRA